MKYISSETEFKLYDPVGRCLVSADGWRLPVVALLNPGTFKLAFAIDPERTAERRGMLEAVK